MTNSGFGSVEIAPLRATSDLAEFVSKLEGADVYERFGHPIEPARLPVLLVPTGPRHRALGAWEDGTLVGTAMLATLGNGQCEIAILVRSDMKRRGIGIALTYRALNEAEFLGASEVIAQIRFDNRAALALLRSAGFSPVGGLDTEMSFVAKVTSISTPASQSLD